MTSVMPLMGIGERGELEILNERVELMMIDERDEHHIMNEYI